MINYSSFSHRMCDDDQDDTFWFLVRCVHMQEAHDQSPQITTDTYHIKDIIYQLQLTTAASFAIHFIISKRASKHEESFLTPSLRWSLPLAFLLSPHYTLLLLRFYIYLSIWSLLLPSFLPTNFQSAMPEFCLLLVMLIALYRQSFTKIGHLHSKKVIYVFLFYF